MAGRSFFPSAPSPAPDPLPGAAGIADGDRPPGGVEIKAMGECHAPHVLRDHRFKRQNLVTKQASDLIVEVHSAEPPARDAQRAGIRNPITAVVDLLPELVHRTEAAIAGEEVRVALGFRARTDVFLAGELLRRLVREVVAHDTGRKRPEVDLGQRPYEAPTRMALLPVPKDRGLRQQRRGWLRYAPTPMPRRRRGRRRPVARPSRWSDANQSIGARQPPRLGHVGGGQWAIRRCGATLSPEAQGVKSMRSLLPQPGGFST